MTPDETEIVYLSMPFHYYVDLPLKTRLKMGDVLLTGAYGDAVVPVKRKNLMYVPWSVRNNVWTEPKQ